MRKKRTFEDEIIEMRSALNEAAKAIADLAKEAPATKTRDRKLGTGNRTQDSVPKTSRPTAPTPPIPVYPTGSHELDVTNLEKAILKAGKGGVVLLKAKDESGRRMHFNLTSVTDLSLPFEVSLKSEKDARIKFSN